MCTTPSVFVICRLTSGTSTSVAELSAGVASTSPVGGLTVTVLVKFPGSHISRNGCRNGIGQTVPRCTRCCQVDCIREVSIAVSNWGTATTATIPRPGGNPAGFWICYDNPVHVECTVVGYCDCVGHRTIRRVSCRTIVFCDLQVDIRNVSICSRVIQEVRVDCCRAAWEVYICGIR